MAATTREAAASPGTATASGKSFTAAECSFGRVVSPPGMHARLHVAPIGDKGLANDWVCTEPGERDAIAVIPPKADRKTGTPCEFAIDRWRHLIVNFFCNFKQ